MKTGAIVQARTSSTRLPGKVLKDLPYGSGITVLEQVIRRLKRSEKLDTVIIATTLDIRDDEIVKIANKEKVPYYRGDMNDLLSRYYHTAVEYDLDIIVRITSDCPVIDPKVVDQVVGRFFERKLDYTANTLKRTYPHGMDVEVFTFYALEKSYRMAQKDYEREHVTPYIRMHPEMFKFANIEAPEELYGPDIRVTLDTEEDYALLCAIYDYLYFSDPYFTVRDIIKLIEDKPWLRLINNKVVQKKILNSLEEEIDEAVKVLELQDLKRAAECLRRCV